MVTMICRKLSTADEKNQHIIRKNKHIDNQLHLVMNTGCCIIVQLCISDKYREPYIFCQNNECEQLLYITVQIVYFKHGDTQKFTENSQYKTEICARGDICIAIFHSWKNTKKYKLIFTKSCELKKHVRFIQNFKPTFLLCLTTSALALLLVCVLLRTRTQQRRCTRTRGGQHNTRHRRSHIVRKATKHDKSDNFNGI